MAVLRFSYGTMGSGKSTLALQIHHNLSSRGLRGLLCTQLDRDGARVSSRLGVSAAAVDVGEVQHEPSTRDDIGHEADPESAGADPGVEIQVGDLVVVGDLDRPLEQDAPAGAVLVGGVVLDAANSAD